MILPDVNLLVSAHREEMPHHTATRRWLTTTVERGESIALASATVGGLVRLVTHPKVFPDASTQDDALGFVDDLLAIPVARWVEPGPRWWSIFSRLCHEGGAKGNLVPDAALAALAIEHGCELATTDRGFGRYPGLRWSDPLDRRSGGADGA